MFCHCGKKSRNVTIGGPCATCEQKARKLQRMVEKKAASDANRIQSIRKAKRNIKPIAQISKKQAKANRAYSAERGEWIKDKRCAVYPEERATEVHHMKGRSRSAFADDWARVHGISLLMDKRYWLPVSARAHKKITDDSGWALENNYSFKRTA